MTDEHDARRAPELHARTPDSEADRELDPALQMGMICASASASLSIVDIPAIVRRRARPRPRPFQPESSGLVDVGELCFGEGLSRAPITPLLPITADPEPARRVDHERGLLWAMTAAAAVAVSAMFAVAIAQEPAPVIIRAEPDPAPTMAIDRAQPSGDGAGRSVERTSAIGTDDEPDDETPIAQPSDEDVAIGETAADPKAEPTPRSSRSKTPTPRPARPPSSATPEPKAAPSSAPKTSSKGEMSVECVLDPASCGLGAPKPEPGSPPPAAAPKSLPEKLGTTALRAVLGPAKSAAQACGPRHGAASGTQVQVKLSIAGATGRVQSATPLGEHAGTALGRCVADSLEAAVFPPFAAAQQGVVWPIRL